MEIEFTGEIWYWRGPSPFHFVTVPEEGSAQLEAVSGMVSYGWGMIPVQATIGATRWRTALFPKDELYVLPLKDKVRNAQDLDVGDAVTAQLFIDV
jgi:hypothetical protein